VRRPRPTPVTAQPSIPFVMPTEPPHEAPAEGFTAVARVRRPHGIRGELRLEVFNPTAPHLAVGRTVHIAGNAYRIAKSREDRGSWLVALEGLADRNRAERFRTHIFEVPDSELIRDDEDSYFLHELIGMRVVTASGRELGTLSEILQPGANDVYVIRGPRGEVLIPAIGQVINRIDTVLGVMTITPPPGLLDEPE
jgi:16S rRNA processing protein RimM